MDYFMYSGTTSSFLSSPSFHVYHSIYSDTLSKEPLVHSAFTVGDKHASSSVVGTFFFLYPSVYHSQVWVFLLFFSSFVGIMIEAHLLS